MAFKIGRKLSIQNLSTTTIQSTFVTKQTLLFSSSRYLKYLHTLLFLGLPGYTTGLAMTEHWTLALTCACAKLLTRYRVYTILAIITYTIIQVSYHTHYSNFHKCSRPLQYFADTSWKGVNCFKPKLSIWHH